MITDKITRVSCLGDKWHNEDIDNLFNNVDKRTKVYKNVKNILDRNTKQSWIHRFLTKDEIKRFNAVMKTKTEKTAVKRVNRIIELLNTNTYGGALFNKDFVKDLNELIKNGIIK